MRRASLAACLAIASSLASSIAQAQTPLPRIVSINLCTDQLVLALADPAQIMGLSPYARDATQSYAAAQAARFPRLSGGAEDAMELKPDIVFAGSFTNRATREFLKSQHLDVAEFDVATSIEDIKAQILRAGDLLGHPDRAQTQAARIDAALTRARAALAGQSLRVLPVSRRGWIDGRGSLVDSLLRATGLRNAASDVARHSGGFASLETIVTAHPDVLLVSEAGDIARDQSHAFLLHPALEALYPRAKRIILPERYTVCGGAMFAEAVDRLVADIGQLGR